MLPHTSEESHAGLVQVSHRGNSPEEMRPRPATQVRLQLLHLYIRLMCAGCPLTGSPYHICCICSCPGSIPCSPQQTLTLIQRCDILAEEHSTAICHSCS